MQEYKKCNKCGEIKLKTCFHTDRKSNDNLVGSCKKCISKCRKKWYQENLERVKENSRKWKKENPERFKENQRKWRKENPDFQRKWKKEKRQTDPIFKLKCNISKSIRRALKNIDSTKSETTLEILGCGTYEKFKEHMQSQFSPGMTWDNYGKWHNDHIVPLATAKTDEQIKKLSHYTNLQPLWAKDNLSKGAKLNWRK